MPFKRKIPGLPLACNERSQTASGSHLVCVDLLPLLNSHKSSGKLVLERSELGKSCLRQMHCLTKNLTLRSTRTTPSGIIVAFSTIPPLHQFPFVEKTGSPYNAFSRVRFLLRQSGGKYLSCRKR